MAKIIELNGSKNRVTLSSLGGRIVRWDVLDGSEWRQLCRGDREKKPSEDNYRACVMFPWVNRIGGDHWSFEGVPVPLDLSGKLTHLHGLTFDAEWEVVESGAAKAVFRTVLDPQKYYPRRVEATISYALTSSDGAESLSISILSRNLDSKEIAYVTTGIHPYFLNPFGGIVNEMELFCAAEQEFAVDERLIPTGLIAPTPEHDFNTPRKIAGTLLDNGFVLKTDAKPAAGLKIKNFSLEFFPVENCGYMQVYIPPHREEVAMEPQSGGADAFRFHQYGLQRLKPGESFNYAVRLTAHFSLRFP